MALTPAILQRWKDNLYGVYNSTYFLEFNSTNLTWELPRICNDNFTWFCVLNSAEEHLGYHKLIDSKCDFRFIVDYLINGSTLLELKDFLEAGNFDVKTSAPLSLISDLGAELVDFKSLFTDEMQDILVSDKRIILCVYLYCLDGNDLFDTPETIKHIGELFHRFAENPQTKVDASRVVQAFKNHFGKVKLIVNSVNVSMPFRQLTDGIASFLKTKLAP